MDIRVGDIVARKSYGCDILFKVYDIAAGEGGKTIYIKA